MGRKKRTSRKKYFDQRPLGPENDSETWTVRPSQYYDQPLSNITCNYPTPDPYFSNRISNLCHPSHASGAGTGTPGLRRHCRQAPPPSESRESLARAVLGRDNGMARRLRLAGPLLTQGPAAT